MKARWLPGFQNPFASQGIYPGKGDGGYRNKISCDSCSGDLKFGSSLGHTRIKKRLLDKIS